MVDGGWGHGRGRDEQEGADYIAELSITERHTKRRRDGRDEQEGADYIAELSIPKGIRSVDAMVEMSRKEPIILLSLVYRKAYEAQTRWSR